MDFGDDGACRDGGRVRSRGASQIRRSYSRADEFIDLVVALWETWDADALTGDKARIFANASKVHEVNHVGPNSWAAAASSVAARPPRHFPCGLVAARRDQAARVADVVFTAQHMAESAKEFRADIRNRAAAYGRNPDTIKVLPGINIVLGRTIEEANDKKAALENALSVDQKLRSMSFRSGLPVETLRDFLDRPFPFDKLVPDEQLQGGTGSRKSTVDLAMAENLTVRELLARAPSGHHHIIGTADLVAETMMDRLEGGAVDGFVLMIDVLPEGMNDVLGLLVPELQKRGVFQKKYGHFHLRDSLGIGAARPLARKAIGAPMLAERAA